MKILITGCRGMLGQELVNIFSKEKYFEVIAWDKADCDITNKNEVQEKILFLRPDILINAAAYNLVDQAEKEMRKAYLINGFAVGFLAEIAEKLEIPIVHYSSDYIFRGDKKDGYKEDDIPDPQSVYGKSKFLGEQELLNKCSKFYLIRISRLFGRAGSGENVKKSFVDTMLDLSKEKNELKIIDGELSSPTYAFDVAGLTFEIVKNKMPFGIYHGTNSGACTWYGFAAEIFKIVGRNDIIIKPITPEEYSRPAARPTYSVLLNTKLPRQRSWQEALRDYLFKKFVNR